MELMTDGTVIVVFVAAVVVVDALDLGGYFVCLIIKILKIMAFSC